MLVGVRANRFRSAFIALSALALGGCISTLNEPVNAVAVGEIELPKALPPAADGDGTTIIGLGFSGGGTRAAAFSYGMLKQLGVIPLPGGKGRTVLDDVRFISGVSGGSVTAAYFGLKGKEGYGDFREAFLIRDAEQYMKTSVGPASLLAAMGGGVNSTGTFGRWLDQNLFHGAQYASLWRPGAPIIWINASDLYNRTPFVFDREVFAALCSDLGKLPISQAVAASSAVPVVFSPIVIQSFGTRCTYQEPVWLQNLRTDPNTPASLKAFIAALDNYRAGESLKYVKLVDGGITDNFGVTSVTVARAQSRTPYGPLSPRQAVRIKRFIYLVADAGQTPAPRWGATVKGPKIKDLVSALSDTAMASAKLNGFDAFRLTMMDWEQDIIAYRCGLSDAEVQRLRGSLAGWNCRDVKFYIDDVDFEDVPAAMRAQLEKVPTRLSLPTPQVDISIAAGEEALRNNLTFRAALKDMGIAKPPSAATAPPPTVADSN